MRVHVDRAKAKLATVHAVDVTAASATPELGLLLIIEAVIEGRLLPLIAYTLVSVSAHTLHHMLLKVVAIEEDTHVEHRLRD